MKVFINSGHKVGIDPGACNPNGTTEAEVVLEVGRLVCHYLNRAGIDTDLLQSNSLCGEDEDADNPSICRTANNSGASIFVSIHCNSGGGHGTETLVYANEGNAAILADAIQTQIVNTLGTTDRGVKERSDLAVLKYTSMPAVLVELAFIDTECDLITSNIDEFAKAIARGVTDYQSCFGKPQKEEGNSVSEEYVSKYFSNEETMCHCGCGGNTHNPYLLQGLDRIREAMGRPLEISCAYRCPEHNRNIGGVENSQHTQGTAADVQKPDDMEWGDFLWYINEYSHADGIGQYDWGCHIDYRSNGEEPGVYRWEG